MAALSTVPEVTWPGSAICLAKTPLHAVAATVKRVLQWEGEIETVSLGDGTDLRGAAPTLEIFLDRLAWRSLQTGELAADYLPDRRYAAGTSAGDRALRSALGRFTDELTTSCDRALAGDRLAEG